MKISLEHCIVLHSNEKAPFHILIEVDKFYHEADTPTHKKVGRSQSSKYTVSKGMNENLLIENDNSADSLEDDETVSLRSSGGSTLSDSQGANPFEVVEDKRASFLEPTLSQAPSHQQPQYSNQGYRLARTRKKKAPLWKQVLLCQCEEVEEMVPIVNETLDIVSQEDIDTVSQPIGLFGEKSFKTIKEELREESKYGDSKTWDVLSVIVKSGENIQQEKFASYLMEMFIDIFKEAKVNCWLRPFTILATSPIGGIVETITDAVSIDKLKKSYPDMESLRNYYVKTFGSVKSKTFKRARQAFVRSLAGYSLLCYILQIKDRHNANILIDSKGHVVHVDFGFMLSNSPGSMNFEASSFKLTNEFVDIMGGQRSQALRQFKALMIKGFMALRKHAEQIISFVEVTMMSNKNLSCFSRGSIILDEMRERFKLDHSDLNAKKFMYDLIESSTDHWRTRWYDKYQRLCVGVW